ncbi:NUMOD4 motif-containing HNH endonuclease [Mycolicibacterium peregrinum]|uniref:NUMOD4 motif-containing HNH endonuclease n=1 Tax=Mycolicibacterium peregrinum TaxID=43304 RepID=UPI003AB06A37
MSTEIWKPVTGFIEYSISNHARVRSEARIIVRSDGIRYRVGEKILKTTANADGYPTVGLSRDGESQTFYVHDLVAQAFIGDKPEGMEVRHLDDVKADCRPSNLAYGSRSENVHDSVRNGNHGFAKRTACKRGHEYSPENTVFRSSRPTTRICLTCDHDSKKRYHDRRAA